MFKAQALTYQKSSKIVMDPSPPLLAQLHHTQALAHVGEYVGTMCTLIPNTLTIPSDETMIALFLCHPFAHVNLHPFVDDFHP
jgi:hypothetical protein